MKSLKSKIVLSGLVLLFALVATIGSTFAWFTVSNTVTVAPMELNVKSSESLLIKAYEGETGDEAALLNANNYKANLALSDITGSAEYTDLTSWYMTDVTATASLDGTTLDGKLLQTMSVDTKAWSGVDGTPNSATGNFIEIKFWLLSQGSGTEDIILSDLVVATADANSTTQDNVVNAVRVAVYADQAADTDLDEDAVIYATDPDYDFTFSAGMRGYDAVTAANNSILAASRDDLVTAHGLFWVTAGAVTDVSTTTRTAADTIYTVTQNVPTLFAVRIYIEGWDADTTNGILAAAFDISFSFALKNIA